MPYYHWRGVDIAGRVRKGKSSAYSLAHLDKKLFKQGIALIKSKQARVSLFSRSIQLSQQIHLFRQLAMLLEAGILLPDALDIVADQLTNMRLQEITHKLAASVTRGYSFSSAVYNYPKVFDPLILQIIAVGYESGNLAHACDAAAIYLETCHVFNKKIQSVLAMPMLTGIFLCVVAGLIFGIILPRFVDLFGSMQQELPPLTRRMIAISSFIRSGNIVYVFGCFILVAAVGKHYFFSDRLRAMRERLVLWLPFIGSIVQNKWIAHLLYGMGVLLSSGMRLMPALQVIRDATKNTFIKQHVVFLINEIHAGSLLSTAMAQIEPSIFNQESIALIRIGEESGNVAVMIQQASELYQSTMQRKLSTLTFLIQPMCLLLLGLLVTLLIFAVYLPIINIAHVI